MAAKKKTADARTAAAIALALHMYLNDNCHDIEPGVITIDKTSSDWSCKALTMRRKPIK